MDSDTKNDPNQQPTDQTTPNAEVPTPAQTSQPSQPAAPGMSQTGQQPTAGSTISMVGFVLALVSIFVNFFVLGILAVVALILSIVGLVISKRAGARNGFALAGVIISAIVGTLTLIAYAIFFYLGFSAYTTFSQECTERGPGTHQVTYMDEPMQIECDSQSRFVDSSSAE